ncbi:MAG: hypothetical protein NC201_05220 [Prevotella sp.]|nr:hypothetical protein [Bacteroides sp.]MCM1366632.1 hypothetical protein [Prevotella sp.]MCM1436997.1 hypothetical protein [Prevotella sp.]
MNNEAERHPSRATLWIFNPETDFALASEIVRYTPPKQIITLKNRLALLPALYASKDDYILVDRAMSHRDIAKLAYYNIATSKGIHIINSLPQVPLNVSPWGWNKSLRHELLCLGIDESTIPSESRIETLRRLSHRRLSIESNRLLNKFTGLKTPLPVELFSVEEANDFMTHVPNCYFKSPWSSSGRGIMIGGMLNERQTNEWLHGVIRRQGSVMAEIPSTRKLDFGTEWKISAGAADFIGLSLFETTPGGSYICNLIEPQDKLRSIIEKELKFSLNKILIAQKRMLGELIAPHYSGPLGIDCCIDTEGRPRPCLEINLRMTMGHIAANMPTSKMSYRFTPGKEIEL